MPNFDPESDLDLAIPILPSRSIRATLDFYRALGFEGDAHASDAAYAILTRGTLELHFFHHPTLIPAESDAGCYLRVRDVRAIHADAGRLGLADAGIPRIDPLSAKPWGLLEFAIVDPDGNLLRIGQVL
ncbi:MAG: VOC family protein [Xanthomonadales bacterium]|jgi:catechol 2,3-dioxygenase-like lactoylglutathione lyase family enzyme|nr:VOC family protein [Xanthomonadales bacterium]